MGSLAIRPWTSQRSTQPTILEQLERVNRERGHFREITTSKLQEELATEGALQLSDEEDSEDGSEVADDDEGSAQPRTREELFQVRNEMLQKVATAHNEVMMALDFISLLESKDNAAGKQTMSQYLKENVPAGTLGTDLWQRMPLDAAREEQDAKLAYNVRLNSLQQSADSILNAAKKLESNVERETRYWNEVLSITDAGWNVCRVSGQRHKLGVRFGFSESGPEFNRGGIAALESSEDGTVMLDRGLETRAKAVHVTIRDGHDTLGSSSSMPLVNNGSIEAEIKQARDSLFDAELFREMEREARTLIPLGVTMRGGSLTYPLTYASTKVQIDIELLSHEQAAGRVAGSSPFDFLAQGILSTLKLLLCQAHREHLAKRSKIPPPMSEARSERQLLPILRPLLFVASQYDADGTIKQHLEAAVALLRQAGISSSLEHIGDTTSIGADASTFTDLLTGLLSPSQCTSRLKLDLPDTPTAVQITVESSPTAKDKTAIWTVAMSDGKTASGYTAKQTIWLIDQTINSAVATLLQRCSKGNWRCVDGSLERQKTEEHPWVLEAEVQYNSRAKTLQLDLASTTKLWTHDQASEQDIYSAWRELYSQ